MEFNYSEGAMLPDAELSRIKPNLKTTDDETYG